MYNCPHCFAPCYSIWQRLTSNRRASIVCVHCGGKSRVSDRARLLEALGAELLGLAVVIAFFAWHWWAVLPVAVGVTVGLIALGDLIFPLVAAEAFGSASDTRRAAAHFWLIAPLALAVVLFLIVTMVKG